MFYPVSILYLIYTQGKIFSVVDAREMYSEAEMPVALPWALCSLQYSAPMVVFFFFFFVTIVELMTS